MFFKERKKRVDDAGRHVSLLASKDGGLSVNRTALHQSDSYKRQVEALIQISKHMKQPT